MNTLRRLPILLLLLAACDGEGEGLSPRELAGVWQFTTESGNVQWRRDDIRLVLDEDGTLLRAHNVHADNGRPGDHLRAFTRAEGTYLLRGDSMIAEIARVEHWDYLQQRDPQVQNPTTYAEERYRVRLVGDRLLLEENRLVEGQPVTYHHTFRRLDETDDDSWAGPGR